MVRQAFRNLFPNRQMKLGDVLQSAVRQLASADVGSPRMNAEVLLMFTLACDRAYLYAHPERELTSDEQARYEEVLAQRARGVPSQYITGHQEFWGLDFIVSPAVLIPRPETEHVIETVLELVTEWKTPRIVDVGTGSGCIAIAVAKELPHAQIHAVDISSEALEIARANAARHELEELLTFDQTDLLTGFETQSFDFVISNPPYVGESEADKVQRQVREFEPQIAVFGGATGMDIYQRLIPQAWNVLRPAGWLVVEIGYSVADAVKQLLTAWEEVRVVEDLQGIPRVVAARKPSRG